MGLGNNKKTATDPDRVKIKTQELKALIRMTANSKPKRRPSKEEK